MGSIASHLVILTRRKGGATVLAVLLLAVISALRLLAANPEEQIRLAAPLHDLGKLAVSDTVLLKRGKLTAQEFAVIKGHVPAGESILAGSRSAVLQLAQEIVRTHHERWDGTGYPADLAGDEIPISGRIVALVDVFDALTHERPYKAAWSIAEARAELIRLSGRHFDPAVIAAFETLGHDQLATLVYQDPSLAEAAYMVDSTISRAVGAVSRCSAAQPGASECGALPRLPRRSPISGLADASRQPRRPNIGSERSAPTPTPHDPVESIIWCPVAEIRAA